MEKRCPGCGQTVSTDEGGQYCPFCGASLTSVEGNEPPRPEEEPSYFSPWDDRERVGFLKAFVDTWIQTVFSPVKFFSQMPPDGGMGGPMLYGFIMGEIGLLVALMWQGMSVLVPSFLERSEFGYAGAGMAGMTFFFFLSPLLVIAGLFLASAVLHVCLLIVGGAHRSFETTFRVVCYASSTHLFALVPLCGGIVGGIWNLVLQVIGLRETHRASTGQAVVAVFLPAIICCSLVFFGLMALLSRLGCGF